jgi:hypothetical protein
MIYCHDKEYGDRIVHDGRDFNHRRKSQWDMIDKMLYGRLFVSVHPEFVFVGFENEK